MPDPQGAVTALADALPRLREAARAVETRPLRGHVTRAVGTMIHAVVPGVKVGELCRLEDGRGGFSLEAEVVGLSGETALLTPIGGIEGLSGRVEVVPTGRMVEVPVGDALLGRILDGRGRPLDGGADLADAPTRPLRGPAPNPLTRQLVERPMPLGVRVIDGLLTVGEGQRLGIYGEPGGGKSSLLAQIVKGTQADICVIALIGERGREVREFIERHLGRAGMARSVLVVSTSDRAAVERVQAAQAATAIAEHFRDAGQRVVLMMDSVTRYARALREIGLAAGEPAVRRGFPPSVFAELPRLFERAGTDANGAITGVYTVLLEDEDGGDPVGEEVRSILDGHILLSRKLGAAGHYPAIDVLGSLSRLFTRLAAPDHRAAATAVRALMAKHAEIEFLVQVGEYRPGADALADRAIAARPEIDALLRQPETERSPMPNALLALRSIGG